jgi:hypothetical protein
MAVRYDLPDFVTDSPAKSLSRPQSETILARAGWDNAQVKEAVGGFADVEFPVPVPRPKPYLSGGQAWMYVVAVVMVSVVAGFVLVVHPSEVRARRLYERRVEDLRRLSTAVNLYQNRHGSLPASQNDASRETGGSEPLRDPITGRLYPYQVVGVDTYELCRRLSTQFRNF